MYLTRILSIERNLSWEEQCCYVITLSDQISYLTRLWFHQQLCAFLSNVIMPSLIADNPFKNTFESEPNRGTLCVPFISLCKSASSSLYETRPNGWSPNIFQDNTVTTSGSALSNQRYYISLRILLKISLLRSSWFRTHYCHNKEILSFHIDWMGLTGHGLHWMSDCADYYK